MEILRGILERLFYISLVSSMMFGIIVIVRLLFLRRIKAKFMYFLWILFLIRLIFLWEIPLQTSIENYVPIVFEEFQESREIIANPQVNQKLITYGALEKEVYQSPNWSTRVMDILVYIWLFGVFSIMLFPLVSYLTLMKALEDDECSTDPRIDVLAYRAAKHAKVERLQIRYSYYMDTPALIGVIHPMIILPYEVLDYDDEVIYQILLHELVHFGSQHLIMQWGFWIVKAIYWFNPIVWIAHEWMKMDAEYACDDEVIAIMGEKKYQNYGNTLIQLASHQGKKNYAIHASGLVNSKKELYRRIGRISNGKKNWRGLEYVTVIVLIVMLPIFFTVEAQNVKMNVWSIEQAMNKKVSVGDTLSLEAKGYSYDSLTKEFRIVMDYTIAKWLREEIDNNAYALSFGLIFPESYNKQIRETAALERVELSETMQSGEPFVLTFNIDDYNLEGHGRPLLVFLGYEFSYNLMENEQIQVNLLQEEFPIKIEVNQYLTLEIIDADVTQDNSYEIRYAYEADAPILLDTDTPAYISLWDELYMYNSQGEEVKTSGSSGSSNDKYITKTIHLRESADVNTVILAIYGYQIYQENHLLYGTRSYQDIPQRHTWSLPINEEDIIYE